MIRRFLCWLGFHDPVGPEFRYLIRGSKVYRCKHCPTVWRFRV